AIPLEPTCETSEPFDPDTALDLDLSTPHLAAISKRIDRVLRKRSAISMHGLQYRLCEVGRSRIDTRTLRRALEELTGNARPRRGQVPRGPREPISGIFVAPDLDRSVARQRCAEIESGLEAVSIIDWSDSAKSLAGQIGMDFIAEREWQLPLPATIRLLSSRGHFPAYSQELRLVGVGPLPIAVWVSNDLEWIYPDDWRLWKFLRETNSSSCRALIVARKISPGTFSLLKTAGAIGLQFYSIVSPVLHSHEVERIAENAGWPHVRAADDFHNHPLLALAERAIKTLASRELTIRQSAILQTLTTEALADPERSSPLLLLDWHHEAQIDIPSPWLVAAERWGDFAAYSRRAKTVSDPYTDESCHKSKT
ncbi:MAG: hypothetical protein M3Z10_02175, partial [Gemmatimonadota bacterium]|nr:hypothetical protein [Gemmatimonadota bacterium]